MNEGADKALKDAIAAFFTTALTNDVLWAGVFHRVNATTRNRWRDHLRARMTASPNLVRLGFPRSEEPWPAVAVTLNGSSAVQEMAGRSDGYTDELATRCEIFKIVLEDQIGITCVSLDIGETRWLSMLAFAAVLSSRDYMVTQGYPMVNFQGMQDLRPEETYLPPDVFVRHASWGVTENIDIGVPTGREAIVGPPYVGMGGEYLGNGHTGGVVPVTDL